MITRFQALRKKRTERQKKFTNMKIRYVIESCDGFLWEEEYHFDSLSEAKIEIDKLRISVQTRKYRLIRQEWEVIDENN